MSEQRSTVALIMMFIAVFATLLLVVLFTAVKSVRADVLRPNIDKNLISITAGPGTYDASSGVLTVQDDTGVFSFRDDGAAIPHFIFNLDNEFGGGYLLNALFSSVGTNAGLDGLLTGLGGDNDLIITGRIPTLSITPEDGYSGTLLTASVVSGELFGFGSSNRSAEYNLHLLATGGDLVTAGKYNVGDGLGLLSVLLSLEAKLPEAFQFDEDFNATIQSGNLGQIIPEPTTLVLLSAAAPLWVWKRRRRKLNA